MSKENEPERSSRILYQAGIVAFHDVHEKLLPLSLQVMRPREPRQDGSWVERVMLKPGQIETVVKAGAVVVIEGIVDLRFPQEWIMSREQALARLEAAAAAAETTAGESQAGD